MYYDKFIKSEIKSNRFYLQAGSYFLIDQAIYKIIRAWDRQLVRIVSASDNTIIENPIFGRPRAYLFGPNINPKILTDYMIKIGKEGRSNKYIKAGFEEVICDAPFPNQVIKLTKINVDTKDLDLPQASIIDICEKNHYDLDLINNTLILLQYYALQYDEITNTQLIDYCSRVTQEDVNKIINYFLDGRFNMFFDAVVSSRIKVRSLLWPLLTTLNKMYDIFIGKTRPKTWYQKRLQKSIPLFNKYGLGNAIIYLTQLSMDFKASEPLLLLKLKYLMMDL